MGFVLNEQLPGQGQIVQHVQNWVDAFILGLKLCPFAPKAVKADGLRYQVSDASTEASLLQDLLTELVWLDRHPQHSSTLLIHPAVLSDFQAYNDFLDIADALVADYGYEGVYQLASFHPHYQYQDSEAQDAENFANRAPYPLLHILRETEVSEAIASHPNIHAVPIENQQRLAAVGYTELSALLRGCCGGAAVARMLDG